MVEEEELHAEGDVDDVAGAGGVREGLEATLRPKGQVVTELKFEDLGECKLSISETYNAP